MPGASPVTDFLSEYLHFDCASAGDHVPASMSSARTYFLEYEPISPLLEEASHHAQRVVNGSLVFLQDLPFPCQAQIDVRNSTLARATLASRVLTNLLDPRHRIETVLEGCGTPVILTIFPSLVSSSSTRVAWPSFSGRRPSALAIGTQCSVCDMQRIRISQRPTPKH